MLSLECKQAGGSRLHNNHVLLPQVAGALGCDNRWKAERGCGE